MSATRDVIAFAQRNGGVFSVQEAVAIGLSKTTLRRRVQDGVFVAVGRGMLALPGTATRPDLAMRAALRLLNGVVSHESAARIHGFEAIPDAPPSITVSHRSSHRFPGVTVHQSTDLLEGHVQEIDGLPVTTAVRAWSIWPRSSVQDGSRASSSAPSPPARSTSTSSSTWSRRCLGKANRG